MSTDREAAHDEITSGGRPRIAALDTLRFFAALAVVIGHSNSVYSSFVVPWPFMGMINAYSAVALFFVLSGYVLHLSCRNKGLGFGTYVAFVFKRVLRLYPLHLSGLLIAGLVLLALPLRECPWLMGSEYMRETIATKDHHHVAQWIQQALLVGGGMDSTFANPPIWTLAVEMRISLLLPFMSFAAMRFGLPLLGFISVLFIAFGSWIAQVSISSMGMVPLFLLGVLSAELVESARRSQRNLGLLAWPGLVVYALAAWTGRTTMLGRLAPFYVAGLGAALMIIAIARCKRLGDLLSHPVLVALGQCSYGIYLFHFPLLLATVWAIHRLGGPPQMILPFALLLTLPLSWFCFRAVEMPFVRLGVRFSNWFCPQPVNGGPHIGRPHRPAMES